MTTQFYCNCFAISLHSPRRRNGYGSNPDRGYIDKLRHNLDKVKFVHFGKYDREVLTGKLMKKAFRKTFNFRRLLLLAS